VVDFSWVATGPHTTKYLAIHGAQVIRIESSLRPDQTRSAAPFKDNVPGINLSGMFADKNCNKYGITLNLGHPKGVAVAKRLVAIADIVTESFAPGVMGRLGLGYEELRKVKPDIIMMSMTIEGQYGPHCQSRGLGATIQALAGVNHMTGWPDRAPVGTTVPYTDYIACNYTAFALLAALDYRRRTGQGQYIDVSQYEASLDFLEAAILDYTVNRRIQSRLGNHHPTFAPHGAYRCQGEERWCAIAVTNDQEWQALCHAMGEPPWSQDPRFATLRGRRRHQEELDAHIEAWTQGFPPEQVMVTLQAAGVPCGIVSTTEDVHNDPQLKHRHHYWPLEHLEMGTVSYDGPSFRLSKTPCEVPRPAPCLGQHNEYIYKDFLGMSEEEYVALLVEGVFE